MVSGLADKDLPVGPQLLAKRMLVDNMVIGQPQQAEHVRIALGKQLDELPDFIANRVPFADESLLNVFPAKSDVMLDRGNEHAHEVLVIYAVGVRGRYVHIVGDAPAVAQQNDAVGEKVGGLFMG